MNMTFTFTLWEVGYFIIGFLIILLLIYLVSCVRKIIPLLVKAEQILEHTTTVTEIAAAKTQEVEGAVSSITESVVMIADIIKGNQSTTKAATNFINSILAFKNILSPKDEPSKKQKR